MCSVRSTPYGTNSRLDQRGEAPARSECLAHQRFQTNRKLSPGPEPGMAAPGARSSGHVQMAVTVTKRITAAAWAGQRPARSGVDTPPYYRPSFCVRRQTIRPSAIIQSAATRLKTILATRSMVGQRVLPRYPMAMQTRRALNATVHR